MKFLYTVWLKDNNFAADDPDHEWPACFIIESSDERSAHEWGDRIAKRYSINSMQPFISSNVESLEVCQLPGLNTLPIIKVGHEATDEEIGS